MYAITYELNSESNTLFLLGLIFYIKLNCLNIQTLKKLKIEYHKNDKDYLKILFKYFKFSTSNINDIYKSLSSNPIIDHNLLIINKYIINVKLNKNLAGFQERKNKPKTNFLKIEGNNVYYNDYKYNENSLSEINNFETQKVKVFENLPTDKKTLILLDPDVHQEFKVMINTDKSVFSEYINIYLNGNYVACKLDLHLWEKLNKTNSKKLYKKYLKGEEIDENFISSLYTNSIKKKLILLSHIFVSNYENISS